MVKKTKSWLSARLTEKSTKWGIGLIVTGLVIFASKGQLGEWADKLTILIGMAGGYKLIVLQETPAK